jgi:hypothetical protein
VRLENVDTTNDEARMKVSAKLVPIAVLCCAGTNNPYFVISRARDVSNREDFVRIYQSPTIQNTPSPIYLPNKIKLGILCNRDRTLPIKFSFYS